MRFHFNSNDDGTANLICFPQGGGVLVADDAHPAYAEIKEAVVGDNQNDLDEDEIVALFDASHKAAAKFENLSERVTVANSRVYVDGDEVNDVYADQVIRFLDEGVDDWQALVYFLEKVYTNTDSHTRDNLARWLNAEKFTISDNGNIVGYKGLNTDKTSIHSGPAIVDGVSVNGHVPNAEGSVIEMPRSAVTHDPARGCSAGLHVGTWDYASGFGSVVMEVEVNPRDVVSVPTECGSAKMRVCRYTVVRVVDQKHDEVVTTSGLVPAEDFESTDEAYQAGYEDGYDAASYEF